MQESKADFASYLAHHHLNTEGDFAALQAQFELLKLGYHTTNFEVMEKNLKQLLAFCDLFALHVDG
eukprot:2574925-Rhodomonas_salina.2